MLQNNFDHTQITPEQIQNMLTLVPRRVKLLSPPWTECIKPPQHNSVDLLLFLPFCQTLRNAFNLMCSVKHTNLTESRDRCYCYLKITKISTEEIVEEEVNKWLNIMAKYVAIRDCLPLSFAIDYDRELGDPSNDHTTIGKLRRRAKTYGADTTEDTYLAADDLIVQCLDFLSEMTCYHAVDTIIAMPPSQTDREYDLPRYLAAGISTAWEREDFSDKVWTNQTRSQIKNKQLTDKLKAISGTVSVDPSVESRNILLIDDIYQSGVSMNYVAMELLNAGAKQVFGLACEKTCRNDDNVGNR